MNDSCCRFLGRSNKQQEGAPIGALFLFRKDIERLSSSLRLETGLGQAVKIVSVEVQWPKPGVPNSIYQDVAMDTTVKLKEGSNIIENVQLKKIKPQS